MSEKNIQLSNVEIFEVGGGKIRITPDGKRASVFDLIRTACDTKYPHKIYSRLADSYPEVRTICPNLAFSGSGQSPTPTVDADGWVRLSMLLPGQQAAEWRVKYASIITRYLRGDRSLADEVHARADVREGVGGLVISEVDLRRVIDAAMATFMERVVEAVRAELSTGLAAVLVKVGELASTIVKGLGELAGQVSEGRLSVAQAMSAITSIQSSLVERVDGVKKDTQGLGRIIGQQLAPTLAAIHAKIEDLGEKN